MFAENTEAVIKDFFMDLLSLSATLKAVAEADDLFGVRKRATAELKYTGSQVELVFRCELKAIAAFYGSVD